MTEDRTGTSQDRVGFGELTLELKKSRGKCAVSLTGVMSVTNISPEVISLASHSGRVEIVGRGLSLSVFENGSLEIKGEIHNVRLGTGKA